MERRKFIKNASVLGSGFMLNHSMLRAFSSNADEKINVGVIGCGDRGKGLMLILKELSEKFNIAAVCDILDFRLKETEKIVDPGTIKQYKDYKQLLDNKSLNAVIIAVPLNMHYPIAIDALAAGKHVYLEKTMTYDISQVTSLVAMTHKYPKKVLQVGHQYRYTPLYYAVKAMIENNYLGKVTQIDCRWDRNWDWRRPVPQPELERKVNWRMYKEYSGGLAAELLSHQIDFINWAFNTHPDSITASGGIDFYKDGRETFDNIQAVLRYSSEGMIGNFGATCANSKEGYIFKIKGTKGMVSLQVNEGVFYPEPGAKNEMDVVDGVTGATKIIKQKDGGIPLLIKPAKDGTYYALSDFYKSIVQQKKPDSNVQTGGRTAVCVHLINRSAYNQTYEHWKPEYDF